MTLHKFLSTRDGTEFEQLKKAVNQGVGAIPASNPGLQRWFTALRNLPMVKDSEGPCRELTAYIAETEVKLVSCLAAVTRYFDATKALSESLRAVRDSFFDYHATCNSSVSTMSDLLSGTRRNTGVIGDNVKRVADVFSSVYDLSVFSPNEIQIFLLDGLVSEVHRTRGLKALLEVRESAMKDYSAAWMAQDKLNFTAKAYREKGNNEKAAALGPKIAEANLTMQSMKDRLDDITKGLLFVETDRLSRIRSERLIAMAGQFAALCIASGVRTQELWTGFLGAMRLNQEDMVRDAQATLTGMSSMHSLDATGSAIALPVPTVVLEGTSDSGVAPAPSTSAAGAYGGAAAVAYTADSAA
ncbi:hypothetical protein EON68_04285, partial [archaeon]